MCSKHFFLFISFPLKGHGTEASFTGHRLWEVLWVTHNISCRDETLNATAVLKHQGHEYSTLNPLSRSSVSSPPGTSQHARTHTWQKGRQNYMVRMFFSQQLTPHVCAWFPQPETQTDAPNAGIASQARQASSPAGACSLPQSRGLEAGTDTPHFTEQTRPGSRRPCSGAEASPAAGRARSREGTRLPFLLLPSGGGRPKWRSAGLRLGLGQSGAAPARSRERRALRQARPRGGGAGGRGS